MKPAYNKTITIDWTAAPVDLTLPKEEVHVWFEEFEYTPFIEIDQNLHILSADEIQKAQRFRFGKDRHNYLQARSWLRTIIGKYLRISPGLLRFGYGEQGKPWLIDSDGTPHSLQFNLSHSGEVVICALAWEKALGIDIEELRYEDSYQKISENFFSPNERLALQSVAPGLRQKAFFNGWTRKEAYLKARGDGLTFPLDKFDVSLKTDEPELISVHDFPEENQRWTLYHLNPKLQYTGALVVEGKPDHLRFFSLTQLDNSGLLS